MKKKKHEISNKSLIVPEYILPCPFTPSPGLSPPTPDPHTHPRRSIPTLCHPDQFQYPLTHLKPFLPIPIRTHTCDALHTHQSLQYPIRLSTPNQSPYAHFRPSMLILGLIFLGPLHIIPSIFKRNGVEWL